MTAEKDYNEIIGKNKSDSKVKVLFQTPINDASLDKKVESQSSVKPTSNTNITLHTPSKYQGDQNSVRIIDQKESTRFLNQKNPQNQVDSSRITKNINENVNAHSSDKHLR